MEPALAAMNEAMFPVPFAPNPTEGLSLVQLNVVALTKPEKVTVLVGALLQSNWSTGSTTVGVGFTVIVNVFGIPVHPLAVGVTLMVATTATEPVFTTSNETMVPLPFAARPMEGWLFVQVKVVPGIAPLKTIVPIEAPLQID